jgi:serine/threonine-protein kinase
MAPEQFLGERATAAVDQFAFCVAIYRALFGAAPFEGEREILTLRRNVLAGTLRAAPPSHTVPAWVSRILLRGLAREPAARFPSMSELLAEIDKHLPLGQEFDPNVGRHERLLLASAMAVFGGIALGAIGALRAAHASPGMPMLIALPCTGLAGLLLAALVLRKRLLGNRFARSVAGVVVLSMLAVVLHRLLALHLGEPVAAVVAVDLFESGMQLVMAAVLLDRAFAAPASLFLGASTLAVWMPQWAVAAYMGAVTASSVVGAVLWAREV